MNQIAIDWEAHARHTDPHTSHAAAARVREFAGGHIAIILDCLQRHGPATADEIAARTGLLAHQINKRLSDAEKRDLARPTGICRLSVSGRPERVWEVMR
jgi:transcription initiation factor IIE alpha subunit